MTAPPIAPHAVRRPLRLRSIHFAGLAVLVGLYLNESFASEPDLADGFVKAAFFTALMAVSLLPIGLVYLRQVVPRRSAADRRR